MGKNTKRLLLFAIKFPGWQSYGKDRSTIGAVTSLVNDGFLEVNEFRQFRLKMTNNVATFKSDYAPAPHFIIRKGQTGTIVGPKTIKMHDAIPGLESWDNMVHFNTEKDLSDATE